MKDSFKLFGNPSPKVVIFWYVVLFALLCLVVGLNPITTLPKPFGILQAFSELYNTSGNKSLLWNVFITLKLLVQSVLYASALALIFSYMSVWAATRPLNKLLQWLRYIPIIGFTLIFYSIFSIGFTMKVAMMTIGLLFFFVTGMTQAIDSVLKMKYELAKTLGMSEWQIFRTVFMRPTMPALIDVILANAAMSWLMIMAVENFSRTEGGMGAQIVAYNMTNQLDKSYAYILMIGIFAVLIDFSGRAFKKWKYPYTAIAERG